MGNSHSSASNKSGTAASSPSAAQNASATTPGHHHHDRPHRKEPRNIIPPHTTHRSAAPPEASLAQAQGSTVVSWPKSLPSTAVSSLSGSPHSNFSTPAKPADVRASRDEPTKPVDVPTESSSLRSHPHHGSHPVTDMYLRGPPRLPLPIEEEVHTPGSPILAPDEAFGDVELGAESSDGLTRKSSALSANTVDDEESEELRVDKTRPVVPTRLEWKRGGDKIYVTGTIFQWNRKQRLHPVEGKPGCFAATIHILPGTHHVRFLVDGIMQTSPDLPTTVDFGNNLVNYIEVNPDDLPLAQKQGGGGAQLEGEAEGALRSGSQAKDQPRPAKGRAVDPPASYQNAIPQYLLDFDQPEESPAYRNAVAAIEKLPTPPSLPGFLGKPILNAATLMKDDNSVLNMPNHTVLNHLATSSIKNNVLAVSATTRYHNKYVTTIMYKPTSADEG
ncbi:5'-AMP-activated protein kinase beta subunit, interaction domain-containing protein [Hirsutella rhossiliensis]|uniref:5'-AMP-activated protein kinase beta subunit, interaction domain-containing protein n=1 Tax=Hirsutella rhossiliensis TaxID=111463 RepID=A0A9P8N1N0_9HYPO|nr:5'-AMP-activated protein kinase beta subunit, interaction domain-containing protein [Hirsutella rhossiliensis]KAH0964957.1 5'-AMP-activated protein kinase beta subunit, interaction domain-containing protein [Hirsutella rhossiliensis]